MNASGIPPLHAINAEFIFITWRRVLGMPSPLNAQQAGVMSDFLKDRKETRCVSVVIEQASQEDLEC